MQVQSLASLSGLRFWHCHELWCRLQMWLRSRVAAAVAWLEASTLTGPVAWEFPYSTGAALKSNNNKKTLSILEYLIICLKDFQTQNCIKQVTYNSSLNIATS